MDLQNITKRHYIKHTVPFGFIKCSYFTYTGLTNSGTSNIFNIHFCTTIHDRLVTDLNHDIPIRIREQLKLI